MKKNLQWILIIWKIYYGVFTITTAASTIVEVNINCSDMMPCLPCKPGHYANASLEPSCNCCESGQCPSNYCSACEEGFYQPNKGEILCLPCSVGFYANSNGSTTCQPCDKGTFTNSTGSKECMPCSSGTFADQKNSTSCDRCQKGYYQNKPRSSACQKCDVGTVCNETGCTTCEPCPAGSEAKGHGLAVCSDCVQDYYKSERGPSLCFPCNTGSYSEHYGSVKCKLCQENFYCPCPGCNPVSCPHQASCPPGSKKPSFCAGTLYVFDGQKCSLSEQFLSIIIGCTIAAVLLLAVFGIQCFRKLRSGSQYNGYSSVPKTSEPFYSGL